jgi:membrane protein
MTPTQAAAAEPGRGRDATRPTEIPARGWMDVLRRTATEVSEDRVLMIAAGVTFYGLLALFPALSALVSIYGLVFDPATVQRQVASLAGLLPQGAMDVLGEELTRLTSRPGSSLSLAFAGSLLVSLWSANAGVKSLFEAMNVAYDETEKRGFVRLTLISLAFTLGALLAVAVALGALVVLPLVLDAFGFGTLGQALARIAGVLVLALLLTAGLAALYRWGPSRERARWRWITPGSILTLVVWVIASALFSWYAANLGSYDATYGSLGSVIGFLFWMWISATIVIVGAELNAELEHQTAADTTDGPPEPMGRRGATMADTLGGRTGS